MDICVKCCKLAVERRCVVLGIQSLTGKGCAENLG